MESKNEINKISKPKTTPQTPSKDRTIPSTSRDVGRVIVVKDDPQSLIPWYRKLWKYLYNNEKGTVCERSQKSWLYITGYSIIYLLFLCTYTMIFLYATLSIIKMQGDYQVIDKTSLLTYSDHGIGLSATPTGLSNTPLIWYKENDEKSYQKYVKAIDELLSDNVRKRVNRTELGPCGHPPYGYGEKPCIVVRVNKHIGWSVNPIHANSTYYKDVPTHIKKLVENKQKKLFLSCDGFHSYDKEHIGKIEYFPDPPGIDVNVFPSDIQGSSPLLAVQISEFTLGMSIAVECKMWYDGPTSSLHFLLYVTPKNVSV
ncbi:PREDICTED: probable sodium/potassium-transporting ATPase subunit beta-3 [Papilio xuthus]|uniref:Probable sodium/potassium-transporting ATPase subunit beta-3 n=2 Tax=Papilio xuthus TaxID=66420 RepID=A0AAJ6ZJC5_PAPXU|nr:PREDICTED: probable sodium/potassium-transporting ATPase subunit beta-3 [Papilio xuthus]